MAVPGDTDVMGDAGLVAWSADLEREYRERYEGLVRVAYMMLGSTAEAEEVVQDAFLASGRRWKSVRHPGSYLTRAVVNTARGVLRRRRTERRHPADPPPAHAPDQLVEQRDVLLGLPARQRTVLVLRYVADLHDDDIAQILGCRRTTVRSLAARGLAALREELS